jgi:uncharacterized protein YhfF
MKPDPSAIKTFWASYMNHLPREHAHRSATPDAFTFGGEGALADELAVLVLSGRKRATTSLEIEFTSENEPLPKPGSVSIVLRGDLQPVAVIECLTIKTVPFESVDAEFAAIEGEGDGSLAYWRVAHIEYFTGVCERHGLSFHAAMPVLCQTFRLLWPAPSASNER